MVRNKSLFLVFLVIIEVLLRLFFRNRGVGIENLGISFGFLPGVDLWLIGLVLLVFVLNLKKFGWGGVLIAVGGVVNFVDRLVYGNVWDYIYFPVLRFWNNGADLMIFAGVIMVIWKSFGKMKILR